MQQINDTLLYSRLSDTAKAGLLLRDCIVYNLITSMLSGLCIAWYYVASPEKASLSLNFLKDTVFAGTLVISLHAVNAILLVFLADRVFHVPPASRLLRNRDRGGHRRKTLGGFIHEAPVCRKIRV